MNPLAHAAVRVSFSALGAFLGWMVGNALGYAVGVALDRATGNDWVSHALLTIRLGGLAGILLGGFLGLRLSRRVTTPRATAVAGVATVFAVVLMVLVIVPIAKGFCVYPTFSDGFDAAAWRADDGDWPCTERAAMLPDVLDRLESGMAIKDVTVLLGPPAEEPGIAWPDRDALIWKVRCGIDCEWLIVSVTEGEVDDVTVATD